MGFPSFTGKRAGRPPHRERNGHPSEPGIRSPGMDGVREDALGDSAAFGGVRFDSFWWPLSGGQGLMGVPQHLQGQRTGEAGIGQGWERGFIFQAATGEAPTACASSRGCSCCSSGAGLSPLTNPPRKAPVPPCRCPGSGEGAEQGPGGCGEGGGGDGR